MALMRRVRRPQDIGFAQYSHESQEPCSSLGFTSRPLVIKRTFRMACAAPLAAHSSAMEGLTAGAEYRADAAAYAAGELAASAADGSGSEQAADAGGDGTAL